MRCFQGKNQPSGFLLAGCWEQAHVLPQVGVLVWWVIPGGPSQTVPSPQTSASASSQVPEMTGQIPLLLFYFCLKDGFYLRETESA